MAESPVAQHVDLTPDSCDRLSRKLDGVIYAVNMADKYALDIEEFCIDLIEGGIKAGKTERIVTAIECITE